MPPYSTIQKQAIAEFTLLTQAKDSVAAKFLRQNGWDVEEAIDSYFQGDIGPSSNIGAINKIFDSYRDDPQDNPDGIGIEGAMRYLGDIGVKLDEVACFGIFELLKAPSMGEFTREGFVNGWDSVRGDSVSKMATHAGNIRTQIPKQPDLFRRVYRYAFPLCRLQGQRNLQFEIATEQWRLFLTSQNGGIEWNTATMPWLDWWIEFLEGRGKRPVNKDLWEQTEVFMRKTREDESCSWWSPDGAWPGTVDEFVQWVQEKRGGKNPEQMEVE